MLGILLTLLASPALAQDQVASVQECPFTPLETPSPARPPDALAPSREFVECVVTAEVDETGKPTPKQVDVCEEPFAGAARNGVSQWRFNPCVLDDGRGVEGTIKVRIKFAASEFQLQGDASYAGLMKMHAPMDSAGDSCVARVRILPDGTVKDLMSSDTTHCLSAARKRTLQHHHLELKKATSCTVEMEVRGSRADLASIKVKGCKGEVAKYAGDTVSSFPWNSPIAGSEHYSVKVTLGPE